MADLDYGYEITIETLGTSDPTATPTNQWQRKQSGGAWADIAGETGETYTVAAGDRSAQIRLSQTFEGSWAFSNELQVTFDEFGGTGGDIGPTLGGLMSMINHPNGKIYSAPRGRENALELDPVAADYSFIGSGLNNKDWIAGALAPNGKIYCPPHYKTSAVLVIDPDTKTTSQISTSLSGILFHGIVAGPADKLYCIPWTATTILEIDTTNDTTSTFGSISGSSKYKGGVLHGNGKIYCIPASASKVLEIDPDTRTVSTFGTSYSGSYKYQGGALAPNGKIYCAPSDASTFLEIDPITKTTSTFGSISGKDNCAGAICGPDGNIYALPYKGSKVYKINPLTKTVTVVFDDPEIIGTTYQSGCLAPNGKIYLAPYSGAPFRVIDLGFPPSVDGKWTVPGLPGDTLDVLAPYFNKY